MEPTEINEFSKEMREAGEASMTHVSLIISILAVLVAMVTVLGHREHTNATLLQTRAADKWNEYQARKARIDTTQKFSDMLSLQPTSDTQGTARKLTSYKAQMEKWADEVNDASKDAKEYEEKVEISEKRASRFDLGEALLQISVVLASITLLTRQSRYVIAALALGSAGLAVAASAFFVG